MGIRLLLLLFCFIVIYSSWYISIYWNYNCIVTLLFGKICVIFFLNLKVVVYVGDLTAGRWRLFLVTVCCATADQSQRSISALCSQDCGQVTLAFVRLLWGISEAFKCRVLRRHKALGRAVVKVGATTSDIVGWVIWRASGLEKSHIIHPGVAW